MKLSVLGCSGGIGGRDLRTTALLVDDDILIDAGTGVGELDVERLTRIDHVFLTHSHLDHFACLPFMVDTVGELRQQPLTVYATEATRKIIQEHVFNWVIWPDFTLLPTPERPFMRFQTVEVGQVLQFGARRVTVLPAEHTVPAVGYQLDSGAGSLVFTGDTTANDPFWEHVNRIDNLRYLLIETAFPNREEALAVLSKHLCPRMLVSELAKLKPASNPEVFLTHLKPAQVELILQEVRDGGGRFAPEALDNDHVFEF